METDNLRAVPKYNGTLDCLTKTCRTGGATSIFRGFNSTLLRESFSFGFYFLSYEWITLQLKHVKNVDRHSNLSTPYILLSGGLAGMITWLSTYPVDVVKSCIQEPEVPKFKGMFDCAKHCYKVGGLRFFFRGVGPCLARAFPANAATFAAYEATRRFFKTEDDISH